MGSMKAMVTMRAPRPPATHPDEEREIFGRQLRLPSPACGPSMALPPVPSMKPKAPMIIVMGKAIFTADRARSPTKLDTNSPSTTLYREVKIIITMVGSV